ncbi:uncharacterized protein LOC143750288 isoform X3 [Siphateles boraxobius]|uniref:uncharacterized protein LOC143750288 isoform X2 n=1 Tax=Siphateles boraxobius TaxID=180520 RepID=UPI004063E2D5
MSLGMSAPSTSPLDKGGVSLVACEHVICQYGRCVLANGKPSCECTLGYTGDSCDETINEAVSVPLTVGVLVIIVGFIVLFFGMAFFRQRQKAKKRKQTAEESLMRNGAHI